MARKSRCPFVLLLYLITTYLSTLVGALAGAVNVSFVPAAVRGLKVGDGVSVLLQVSYSWNGSDSTVWDDDSRLRLVSADETVAAVDKAAMQHRLANCSAERQYCEISREFSVRGLQLGTTSVGGVLEGDGDGRVVLDGRLPVSVVRDVGMKQVVFLVTLGVLIVLANVGMGCQLQLSTVWAVCKQPCAPAVGLCCQFVLMPLLAYALARAVFLPIGAAHLAFGIFTAGCSPSGGASNVWTVLLRGNLDLSVTMTFVSTLAALVTMPLWMFALGKTLLDGGADEATISIPYRHICTSLLTLVVPLLVGVAVARARPKLAERISSVLRPFMLVVIGFICTFGVYANWYMLQLVTWRVVAAGAALPWLGFGVGAVVAVLARRQPADLLTIAIETGVQNSGIAIVLLQSSFEKPLGDVAAVVPVFVSVCTPFPLIAVLLICWLRRDDGPSAASKSGGKQALKANMELKEVAEMSTPALSDVANCV